MLFLLSAFRLVSKKIVFLICLVLLLFHIFLPPKLLSGSFSIIHPLCSTVISLSLRSLSYEQSPHTQWTIIYVSGTLTCSRKAIGRRHISHSSPGSEGRPLWLSHAGFPPTLLGNCGDWSRHGSASSRKPRTTSAEDVFVSPDML